MRLPLRIRLAAFLLAPALAAAQGTTEVIHGVAIADPFRALEEVQSPESQAFFRDQAAKTRAALDALPGRAALLDRIRELSRSGTAITALKLTPNRIFYLRRRGDEPNPSLCVR
jgi:prolyl oligopeptidase